MDKTEFLRIDDRRGILELVMSGFQKSVIELRRRIDQVDWYDGAGLLKM
ncbi:hypothetical protein [Roseivirga misakiensis]|nr:hypothetical protein [Roseivirga misakiensis]